MGARSLTIEREAADLLKPIISAQRTSYGRLIDRLIVAVFADLESAKAVCGGDGKGCQFFDEPERCKGCPVDALSEIRSVLEQDGQA